MEGRAVFAGRSLRGMEKLLLNREVAKTKGGKTGSDVGTETRVTVDLPKETYQYSLWKLSRSLYGSAKTWKGGWGGTKYF